MLWEHDPWVKTAQEKAQKEESKGNFVEAQKLHKLLFQQSLKQEDQQTIHKMRLRWIHSLVKASLLEDARNEAESFFAEIKDKYPEVQIELNMHLAAIAYFRSEYQKVRNISNRLLSSPIADKNPAMKANSFNLLALAERHLGLFDGAIEHFQEALILVRHNKLNDSGSYDSNLALLYKDVGRYSEALTSFKTSLEKAEKAGLQVEAIYALIGMGGALNSMGRFRQAKDLLEKAFDKVRRFKKSHLAQIIYIEFGSIARETGDYESGIDFLETALQSARKKKNAEIEAEALRVRGWIYHDWRSGQDLDAALQDAEESLAIYEQLGIEYGISSALTLKGAVQLAKGDSQAALESINQALDICKANPDVYLEIAKETFYVGAQVFSVLQSDDQVQKMIGMSKKILERISAVLTDQDRDEYLNRILNKKIADF